MRILVVGAGGIGGYFGGRLAAAGQDVTFLVRPKRAELLREKGLTIRSPVGDARIAAPRLVAADGLAGHFDLVLLSCKAYDLDDAIASVAPAIGPRTAILPLLNGMAHLDRLEARFGAEAVLGGTCFISTTIGPDGEILHMNDLHRLTFGERTGGMSVRIQAIAGAFAEANFTTQASETILGDMWEKWVFIAATAGMTCLMRASIGDFVAAGGTELALKLIDECAEVAADNGFALSQAADARIRENLTRAGSPITASMLRDIQAGARIESDQIIGDLLSRGDPAKASGSIMLKTVLAHLKAYEARRAREAAGG